MKPIRSILFVLFLLGSSFSLSADEIEEKSKSISDAGITGFPTWGNPSALIPQVEQEASLNQARLIRENWTRFTPLEIIYMDKLGIRMLRGKYADLYTDMVSTPETDEIIDAIDAAVPLLCGYFHLDVKQYDQWRIEAFLISDREPFELFGAFGLADSEQTIPDFPNGYSYCDRIWVNDKKQPYYNRFLMLHELVHTFMDETFGSLEPRWYSEGIAEFLALHHWDGKNLELGIFPTSPEEVEGFGRIDQIRRLCREDQKISLKEVLKFQPKDYESVTTYAWSWALVTLLNRDPRYADAIAALPYLMLHPEPTKDFLRLLDKDQKYLSSDWDNYISWICYGYDFEKTRIDYTEGASLSEEGTIVTLDANAGGWINTGIRVPSQTPCSMTARGRFRLSHKGRLYPSEANGITVNYNNGRPIGILLAQIISPNGKELPVEIGTQGVISSDKGGTLYLRLNIPPEEIQNCRGKIEVRIRTKKKNNEST